MIFLCKIYIIWKNSCFFKQKYKSQNINSPNIEFANLNNKVNQFLDQANRNICILVKVKILQ